MSEEPIGGQEPTVSFVNPDGRTTEAYDAWVKATDWLLMMMLSLVFVFVLVAPLAFPHLTPDQLDAINAANIAIWLVFLVDYLVRLYLSPERWRFVRTHVVDLLVVAVPFLRPPCSDSGSPSTESGRAVAVIVRR